MHTARMALDNASIGPVERDVRDRVRSYKTENELRNYNEAMKSILAEAGID
jgi:hypothetical protein